MAGSIKTRILLGLGAAALFAASAVAASAQTAPALTSHVKDLGAAPAGVQLSATVHLPLADEKGFDQALAARYDRKSPQYHKWMSQDEIDAFGPAKSEVRTVKRALVAYGLTITGISSDGAEIDVSGAPASLQRAFGAPIRTLSAGGHTFFGAATLPQPQGALAGHVAAVTGLVLPGYQPTIRHQVDASGKRTKGVDITAASPLDAFSNQCFTQPAARTLTDGTNTAAATAGVGYAIELNSTPAQQSCGYTPAQVLQHYGIDQLQSAGFDGTGQTIVIVDAFGSPTALADANTFFAATGVTPFTRDNFKIIYPHGKPTKVDYGWAGETALDIEWAHVVAPGAKIVLVVSKDNFDDLDQATRFAIHHDLGKVISNSWGSPEWYLSRFLPTQPAAVAADAKYYDHFMRVAAAKGISVQFSSGDAGDNTVLSDGTVLPYASPLLPSAVAHVTSVGGTSLDVPSNGVPTETGWGNYRAQLGYDTAPAVPPVVQGFFGGGGGGDSMVYAKPNWERSLPGSFRKTPDVGMMADPYTGAILVEPFGPGDSEFTVIGGTSLASPLFSALWAIADQISNPGAPGSSLGLAAVMMPKMARAGAIVDVAPLNPTAQLSADFEGSGYDSHSYSGVKDGFAILGITADPGALTTLRLRAYDGIGNGTSVLSFNTDTTLQVAPGWDNVTGYGVPNGPALMTFIQGMATAAKQQ